jgi:hypothetical protein
VSVMARPPLPPARLLAFDPLQVLALAMSGLPPLLARSRGHGGGRRPLPPPHDDRDCPGDHQQGKQPGEDIGRGVHQVLHLLPVSPSRVPGPGQAADPGHAPGRCVDAEANWPHAGITRGQRDERPHHRQQAPDEDGPPAIAIEPALRPLDAGPAAKEPRPSARGRLASVPASPPGQKAADHIARHAGHDDQRQAQVHPSHCARRYRTAKGHR